MKSAYVTFLTVTHDKKDTVLVEVPDLDILTEGYGIVDAIAMARDAIGAVGLAKEDMGEDIPNPSDMAELDDSLSVYAGKGVLIKTLVDIDFAEYRKKIDNKSVRRNVTIPNWLNQAAENANLNVSKVLQDALKDTLGVSR